MYSGTCGLQAPWLDYCTRVMPRVVYGTRMKDTLVGRGVVRCRRSDETSMCAPCPRPGAGRAVADSRTASSAAKFGFSAAALVGDTFGAIMQWRGVC